MHSPGPHFVQVRIERQEAVEPPIRSTVGEFGLERTSEKLDATQLLFFVGQLAAEAELGPGDDDGVLVPIEPGDKSPPRNPRLGRNPLPDSLLQEKIRLLPPEEERACPDCSRPNVCIGSEFSALPEYLPAHLKCLEIKRVKLAWRPCESHVVIAPVMDKPIERGRPGPGLLAHDRMSQYADHQPQFRLSKQLLRAGFELAASTLGNWAEAGADLLEPLCGSWPVRRQWTPAHWGGVNRSPRCAGWTWIS